MQILVVAATDMELNAVKKRIDAPRNIDFLVSGIGMLATAYALTKRLSQKKYDWVINVGIAGTFSEKIALGQAVVVAEESLADSGIEDVDGKIDFFPCDWQVVEKIFCPYINDFVFLHNYKKVSGLSVNLLTENTARVNNRISLYESEIETMEGASVFMICEKENVKFMQLRGISNLVGVRDKLQWRTQEALESMGDVMEKVVVTLLQSKRQEVAVS